MQDPRRAISMMTNGPGDDNCSNPKWILGLVGFFISPWFDKRIWLQLDIQHEKYAHLLYTIFLNSNTNIGFIGRERAAAVIDLG